MSYEINVSLNGRHFFATHERSITNASALMMVFKVFAEKFPETEGYKISVTRKECMSFSIDNKELMGDGNNGK